MMRERPFVIAAVGLEFEARMAQGPDIVVCCGRGSALASAIADAFAPDCMGIISFGIAGGLDPRLQPGAAVIGTSVFSPPERFLADEPWSSALLGAHPQASCAPILGVDAPMTDGAGKAAAFQRTAAAVVDMESHIAAKIAASSGLPFAALRIVADGANRKVPQVALAALRADGGIDRAAALWALARTPSELPSMVAIAREFWSARSSLARVRRRLGRGLSFPNLR
jgi:adenosylhomocysteine nucleosidase